MQIKTKHLFKAVITLSAAMLFLATAALEAKYTPEEELIAYPNPFNPATQTLTIKPKASPTFAGSVDYTVYDYNQREVYRGSTSAGTTITWSGYDKYGSRVAPGLYFIKLIHIKADQTTSVSIIKVIIH